MRWHYGVHRNWRAAPWCRADERGRFTEPGPEFDLLRLLEARECKAHRSRLEQTLREAP